MKIILIILITRKKLFLQKKVVVLAGVQEDLEALAEVQEDLEALADQTLTEEMKYVKMKKDAQQAVTFAWEILFTLASKERMDA
jgi:hypothetical protein